MRSRRHSRPQCALCGGPRRHPSTASVLCLDCGSLICLKHAVDDPERGGWVCKRCGKDQPARRD